MEKSLAIIEPLENFHGLDECICNIHFLTGRLKGRSWGRVLSTDIFSYYFYGATIEVCTVEKEQIIEVTDPKREDINEFGIGISYALTFNHETKDILSTNGFVYKFDQSMFCRKFPHVVYNMYNVMWTSKPFVWQLYTINGAIVYVKMITDIKSDSSIAKYRIGGGFVACDKEMLKCMLPKTDADFKHSKEKLSQEEIDKMLEELQDNAGNYIE